MYVECLWLPEVSFKQTVPSLLLLTKCNVPSNLGLELAGLTHEPHRAECVKVRRLLRFLRPRSGAAESLV